MFLLLASILCFVVIIYNLKMAYLDPEYRVKPTLIHYTRAGKYLHFLVLLNEKKIVEANNYFVLIFKQNLLLVYCKNLLSN